MPSQPTTYSITTNKAVMGQVSKERSMTIYVEGLDTILATIYVKEDPTLINSQIHMHNYKHLKPPQKYT